MVELIGHAATALLFAVPAWFLWGRRPAVTFTALTQVTALLPDVDMVLKDYFSHPLLQHHGITHTIPFMLLVGAVFGAIAARVLTPFLNATRLIHSDSITPSTTFVFTTGAFWAGGVSHVLADLLSAEPDTAIAPLWPLYRGDVIVNVIAYDSTPVNLSLIITAVVLHVGLYRAERYPYETRWGIN
ncbi:metal-dependent hydrolase [Haloterrigena alkaliphila]|uniref:Metal-dependent hydrolase n=1 Tax=Haloterrigena alkaliphila TaxID=2816475 RepID=A0A8A2VK74_9EURY|nr:metal-dependent hydrolase [Haloterrigena alkaliphila]QSX00795.1 metal-dependent hydrolase [Haloterrigena alkaliphila]